MKKKLQTIEYIDQFRAYRQVIESVLAQKEGVVCQWGRIALVYGTLSPGQRLFLAPIVQRIALNLNVNKYAYAIDKIDEFLKNTALKTLTFQGVMVVKKKHGIEIVPEKRKKAAQPLEESLFRDYLHNKGHERQIFLPLGSRQGDHKAP